MKEDLVAVDTRIISIMRKASPPLARFAIFVVFFWFGVLKVTGDSSANPLVADLLSRTLPFLTFSQFIIWFGLFEMAIGILFLIPKTERIAILLLAIHMITTVLPLIFLPAMSWQRAFVPTLEGQYIIKNLVIIALAVSLAASLHPLKNHHG
ncbi:MAG: hypothetical protein A3E94_03640 [Candidatus Zambryskibacteria bacterium RIFCSPHIGHO2_12_FULL_44_12b]|uniref:DoxX family protein n=1 Tax=Candidatus Zambryskibacteria bacterium RIFCSPLOWO2_01_FULL_45_21 TaxID=1802761 RepID=A0A1G2U068_9BACT|nr:MAG: hypothetical protein A3E94_03640 [Candidatus Zambryskibacteria bacterium RIFCSPHIGHO2_12_FULL_44_12b]OHB02853.1 MAG: hypothetical protein A3B14_02350 [Candidatus Zambryskibacteria bacterium RIFCSPLOWO2_01_FULL_45_21]